MCHALYVLACLCPTHVRQPSAISARMSQLRSLCHRAVRAHVCRQQQPPRRVSAVLVAQQCMVRKPRSSSQRNIMRACTAQRRRRRLRPLPSISAGRRLPARLPTPRASMMGDGDMCISPPHSRPHGARIGPPPPGGLRSRWACISRGMCVPTPVLVPQRCLPPCAILHASQRMSAQLQGPDLDAAVGARQAQAWTVRPGAVEAPGGWIGKVHGTAAAADISEVSWRQPEMLLSAAPMPAGSAMPARGPVCSGAVMRASLRSWEDRIRSPASENTPLARDEVPAHWIYVHAPDRSCLPSSLPAEGCTYSKARLQHTVETCEAPGARTAPPSTAARQLLDIVADVHRGSATGGLRSWTAPERPTGLLPREVRPARVLVIEEALHSQLPRGNTPVAHP